MADPLYQSRSTMITQSPLPGLWQIGFWRQNAAENGPKQCDKLGVPWPVCGQMAVAFDGGWAYRIAPEKILIRLAFDSGSLVQHLANLSGEQAAVSDLTHSRMLFTLKGASSEELLKRGLSVDLSDPALPTGGFAQSYLQEANLLLHRRKNSQFDLLVPSSFADAVGGWFSRSSELISIE